MLDNAADEVQAVFRQTGIFIASEGWLAVFPDREVNVHTRAVVAENWLWHEGCSLAVGIGYLMHDIFLDLHLVGVADERVEFCTQLVLS